MGIPFDRYTGQDFNIDPETRYYRPATDGSPEVDVTILEHREYGEFVPVSEIRGIIELNPEDFKVKLQEILEEWAPEHAAPFPMGIGGPDAGENLLL